MYQMNTTTLWLVISKAKLLLSDPGFSTRFVWLNDSNLTQKRIELNAELERIKNGPDLEKLETEFIKVAKEYSLKNGISFPAWKEQGVSVEVLAKAGIIQPNKPGRKPRVAKQ